ncbi:MAG: helix-turn-helix transcriptional regulator [Streptococcus gallolyticus]
MKKSERLNHELIFLSERPFFQLKDLMAEFQISKRTALRDMAALEDMGLAFYTETGKNGGYHLVSQTLLTPIYFTQDDLTMIFYALNSLRRLSVTPFDKSYPQIFEKLLVSLSTAQREYVLKILNVLEFYDVPVISSSTFLRELWEATVDEQILDID